MNKLLFICLFLLCSCSTAENQIGVIIPRDITFSATDISQATPRKNIEGEDGSLIFLFFPLGSPKLNAVVNQVLIKGQGNIIINAEITDEIVWYGIWGYKKIIIKGDVVNIPHQKRLVYE